MEFQEFAQEIRVYQNECSENPNNIVRFENLNFSMVRIPIILMPLFLTTSAFAVEEITTIQKPSAVKEMIFGITSLKILLNPTISKLQKGIILGKYGCCGLALTFGTVKEYFPKASYAHIAFSACCAGSWTGYTILHMAYPKDTPI